MVLEDDDDDEYVGGGGQEEERYVARDEGDVARLAVPQLSVREVTDQLVYDVLVRVVQLVPVQHLRVVHHGGTTPNPRPAPPLESATLVPYSYLTSAPTPTSRPFTITIGHLNIECDSFFPLP